MDYRFRINFFGKLVLQVKDSYVTFGMFDHYKTYYWRDARVEDMDLSVFNLKINKVAK